MLAMTRLRCKKRCIQIWMHMKRLCLTKTEISGVPTNITTNLPFSLFRWELHRKSYIPLSVEKKVWLSLSNLTQTCLISRTFMKWRTCLKAAVVFIGKPIVENITEAIYGSWKTICVISRHYLQSEWCSKEIQMARWGRRLYIHTCIYLISSRTDSNWHPVCLQLSSVWWAEGRADPAVPGGHPSLSAVSVLPAEEPGKEMHLPELATSQPTRRSLLAERTSSSGGSRTSGWAHTPPRWTSRLQSVRSEKLPQNQRWEKKIIWWWNPKNLNKKQAWVSQQADMNFKFFNTAKPIKVKDWSYLLHNEYNISHRWCFSIEQVLLLLISLMMLLCDGLSNTSFLVNGMLIAGDFVTYLYWTVIQRCVFLNDVLSFIHNSTLLVTWILELYVTATWGLCVCVWKRRQAFWFAEIFSSNTQKLGL